MLKQFFDMDEIGKEYVTVAGCIMLLMWWLHRFDCALGLFMLVCFLSICWVTSVTSRD